MASERSLEAKKQTVKEITGKIDSFKTLLVLNYQGLTVSEMTKLRQELKNSNSEVTVYKNTLMNLALKEKNVPLNDYMSGPNAFLFSNDIIEPIKLVSKFAKDNENLKIRVGYIDGEVADENVIKEYASIPSYEGLLTMFAGGLIEHVKNLSIALNLYAEKLEEGGNK